MHVKTIALLVDATTLLVDATTLLVDATALLVDTTPLSVKTMALLVDVMALQEVTTLDSVAIAITKLKDVLLLYHPVNFLHRQD